MTAADCRITEMVETERVTRMVLVPPPSPVVMNFHTQRNYESIYL